jgi:hypothetical protein
MILTDLAGLKFRPKEVKARVAELAGTKGEFFSLLREPDNRFDPNAVIITDHDGTNLGYVQAFAARNIAQSLDDGHRWTAELTGRVNDNGEPEFKLERMDN